MSKDLSTNKEKAVHPEKGLPGPLETLYDAQCDACDRGISMMDPAGYAIDGPGCTVLRVYFSARCLATVMDLALVKVLAQEVAQKLAKSK